MNNPPDPIGLGAIGCGGFGLFALQHFAQVPGVKPVAMAGTHREAARAAARRFGMPDIVAVEALLDRPDVDLVYIATPPFLHHEQAVAALRRGKHVICEKPLALTLEEADEMIALARERDRLLVADLMQRYNPIFAAVRALIAERLLGEPLHGTFENYANDERLGPGHWFWDRSKSGGIFVEHGVHFFDLFAGWFGPGRVVAAQRTLRPGGDIEEQAQCTMRYGRTVLVNLYHGFHQTARMDRQELRIVFERGDVTLHEWVPTRVRVYGLVEEAAARRLCELFPGARLDIAETYPPSQRFFHARHRTFEAFELVELRYGEGHRKMYRYGELLRALMADQAAWIRDRSHERLVTEQNGRDALATAVEARRLADEAEEAS